jgi:hypothetical protein
MDQLQGACASPFFLLESIKLLEMGRMYILEFHFTHDRQDMLVCIQPVLEDCSRAAGKCLAIELDFNETLEGDLRSLIGQTCVNLGQCFFNPIPTFLLQLEEPWLDHASPF